MTPDASAIMAEVCAAVACREAARTRRPVAIGLALGCWHVSAGGELLAGERCLATIQPGEMPVSVVKRILGARMAGQTVPKAVLDVFTPRSGRKAKATGERPESLPGLSYAITRCPDCPDADPAVPLGTGPPCRPEHRAACEVPKVGPQRQGTLFGDEMPNG